MSERLVRYKFWHDGMSVCFCEMEETPDGEFVSYEAYAKLQAQVEALNKENRRAHKLISELARFRNMSGLIESLFEDYETALEADK